MAANPDWTIQPLGGVGPLQFGMTPEVVSTILGPPETDRQDGDDKGRPLRGSFTEFRKGTAMPVLSYQSGVLVLADFMKGARTLKLGELELFGQGRQATIDELTDRSTTVFETFEGYEFLDFGISMLSAENARGSVASGNWNIGVFATGYRDSSIRECINEDLGEFIKGGPV